MSVADTLDLRSLVGEIHDELMAAKRPLLVFGAGVQSNPLNLRIPVVVTWGARAAFPDAPSFGTHGEKAGNLAVQNADYILAVGTRLDTKATGSPASSFAPKAKLVMVDIDPSELDKMAKIGRPLYRSVCADAGEFLTMLSKETGWDGDDAEDLMRLLPWIKQIQAWRAEHPVGYRGGEGINPYSLVEKLSDLMSPDDVLVSDTGCGLAWLMQAFKFKGQRFVHAFNQTPMGYGLPAAIGAAFATGRRVVLVTGDGGLSLCSAELATVARHRLNIKILLLNNRGHAMCRQTQRQWLGGEYPATSYEGGLATPDFRSVARAFSIHDSGTLFDAGKIGMDLSFWLAHKGRSLLECIVSNDAEVSPQIKFGEALA